MSVSIGEGLRMMQGGVDRTGFADMADSIGNPGMDLIAARRDALAEAEAMDEYEKQQAEREWNNAQKEIANFDRQRKALLRGASSAPGVTSLEDYRNRVPAQPK